MPPTLLLNQLENKITESINFFDYIQSYNNVLAVMSIGCNEVRKKFTPFKIIGELYQRINSFLPTLAEPSKCL